MIVPVSLCFRLRVLLFALAVSCSVAGLSGCNGGWGDLKPVITASTNQNPTANPGQTATFVVSATGSGPLTYQWFKNGVAIAGATGSTYATAVTANDNGAVYTVAVTNPGGTATSAPYVLTVNKAPAITTPPASQTVSAGQSATFTVAATGTGPLAYQWFQGGVAIAGATSSTYTTPGTMVGNNGSQITVAVTNSVGTVSSAAATLTVNALPATLSFLPVPTQTYGNPAFPVTATSASSGAVTYSVLSGPATISGSTVTSTGTGTVVLGASQAASGNYAATSSTVSFNVVPATPTLNIAPIPTQTFGGGAIPITATSSSNGVITYTVVSGPATVSGSTVTTNGTGTVVLSASQAATGNYTAATPATTSFEVTAAAAALAFAPVPAQTYGSSAFPVSASSASNGAVTYTILSGPATISGNTVTPTGTGVIVVGATQAATANYAAGSSNISVNVGPAQPVLAFSPVASQTFGGPAFAVSASSASTGAVTYTVVSGPATISGNTVTATGTGTVVLSASQAADGNYAAATATTSINVTPASPTLNFAPIASQTFGGPAFAVGASSASTGAVTYTVVSGPATISGNTVTPTGIGTVVLGANQAASGNYTASTATASFTVASLTPTLAFDPLGTKTFGDAAFAVSASSASTGAVTYTVVSGPATISGNTVTVTGPGTVVLSASQAASGNYGAAAATSSFTVNAATPTLAFAPIANHILGDPAFPVTASSASTGAVTYTVVSGPATISGGTVTVTGSGTVVLSASQAASGSYLATTATTSFGVSESVTISPISPAAQTLAPGTVAYSATASGGPTNALTWTATGGTFNGNVWTAPNVVGTYTIRATSVDQPSVFVTTTVTVSAPVITTQPVSQNVCTNASTTLTVAADYASTYQWMLGGKPISGATSASYFIPSAIAMDAGSYTVTVSNPAGSVMSNVAGVVVGSSITSNPQSLSVSSTQTATFSVSVAGAGPFTYRWYRVTLRSGTATLLLAATSSTYTTPALDFTNNAEQYYATVTDACGNTLTSSSATLTVTNANAPPTITAEPLGQTVAKGGTATFSVTASGISPLTYQWYRIAAGTVAGVAVTDATSASYTVPSTATRASNDQDAYYVMVKDAYGQAVSQSATLAVGNGILIQIADEPSTAYVNAGEPATFSVGATAALPLTYQWYKAPPGSSTFAAIAGATKSSYTFSPGAADTGSVFHVVVSNGVTTDVTSSSASLFVGALAGIPACSTAWSTLGNAAASEGCSFQLTAATTNQYGEIVWPTLISTGNLRLTFTIATSDPSPTPADGFAMVLGDPSLGATITSQGLPGEGLGARGIPGFVLTFDDYENNSSGGWPQDPTVPYLGVGRGENALWENPYFNVNTNIPALAAYGKTVSHDYVVSIVQSFMTVTMDGIQVFSGPVSVPPVAYFYVTASTGASWQRTVISNISATVSAPSN
ncbi:MAG: hypothetical protein NVSMB3_01620 [Acidobacteriaceae bacterium]